MPRGVLVAGTRSGCGKTTLTLALLAALRRRGLTVQAGKSGPDFIDPTYHALFTGRPSYNLDSWMGGEAGMRRIYKRLLTPPVPDCLVVEGAMGLFDGARGLGGPGSAAHTARILGLPVLLAADVRGMGQSAAALALGYTRLLPDLAFAGIVCTHVASPAHANLLREAFQTGNLPLLGLLTCDVPPLPSRHLGLYMAHESSWTQSTQEHLAIWLESHMDLDTLLQRLPEVAISDIAPAGTPALRPSPCPPAFPDMLPQTHSHPSDSMGTRCLSAPTAPPAPVRLAVARDEAFCFLYADMPDCLRELGVESVFFSPLRERTLPPDCAGLYFPGGYPELYARDLSANRAMLQAVRAFAAAGGCIYGECGGYIYLMESLEADGICYRMTGCLPRRCRLETRRTALGYREVFPAFPGPFGYGDAAASSSPHRPALILAEKGCLFPGDGQDKRKFPSATDMAVSCPQYGKNRAEARTFPLSGRGHEYHYARLLSNPDAPPLPPLWHLRDRKGNPLPDDGVIHGTVAASWVHLYPEGARELLYRWTQTLRNSTVYTASAPLRAPG